VAYRWLADAVLVVHFAFVVFVALGGLLVLRRPALAWVHLPCVAWAVFVEFAGIVCPLTPLEVALRRLGGGTGYAGDFIGHYVTAVLYPAGLTRGIQVGLGALAIAVNLGVYALLMWRRRTRV